MHYKSLRTQMRGLRTLKGLGDATAYGDTGQDATSSDPSTQTMYTDAEGYTSFGNPDLSATYDPTASSTFDASQVPIGTTASAAAAGAGALASDAVSKILGLVPWWVWVGGGAMVLLALHHEFKD